MSELDLPEVLGVDRAGLIDGLASSVAVFDQARSAAEALEIPFPSDAVKDVLICGMGGSAVAGDLVTTLYYEQLRRPVQVHRGYYLPGWAGPDTLHLLLSYSGETEETLTAAMQAMERESPALAVTSGGKIDTWYGERGVPVLKIPGGLQPRMALLHMLVPTVVFMSRLGIIPDQTAELDAARESIALIKAAGATPHAVAIALDRQEMATEKQADGSTQDVPYSAVQYVRHNLGLQVCAIANLDDLLTYLQTQSGDAMGEHRQRVQAYRARYGVA